MLKLKFKRLHSTLVNNVNPANVIDFLFQEGVIGDVDMRALRRFRDDPHEQCAELLALLHTSENPRAFLQLYAAIKEESHLQWLIERIDKLTDQSLIDLLQQQQQEQPQQRQQQRVPLLLPLLRLLHTPAIQQVNVRFKGRQWSLGLNNGLFTCYM